MHYGFALSYRYGTNLHIIINSNGRHILIYLRLILVFCLGLLDFYILIQTQD